MNIKRKINTIEYGNRELRNSKVKSLKLRVLFYICVLLGIDSCNLNNVDRLLDKTPINQLTNNKRDWHMIHRNKNGDFIYKHKRYGKLMKIVRSDDEIIREAYRFHLIGGLDDGERLYNATVMDILYRMYPINFPYYPEDDPFMVFVSVFNVKHTDDSEFMLRYVKPTKYVAIEEVLTPECELHKIYRYFRIYAQNVYEEISAEEYYDVQLETAGRKNE